MARPGRRTHRRHPIPAAFFLSVASPAAREPNGFMGLAYVGALFLAGAVLSLGVGLIRAARRKGS
jgi:hypothetical protein